MLNSSLERALRAAKRDIKKTVTSRNWLLQLIESILEKRSQEEVAEMSWL